MDFLFCILFSSHSNLENYSWLPEIPWMYEQYDENIFSMGITLLHFCLSLSSSNIFCKNQYNYVVHKLGLSLITLMNCCSKFFQNGFVFRNCCSNGFVFTIPRETNCKFYYKGNFYWVGWISQGVILKHSLNMEHWLKLT